MKSLKNHYKQHLYILQEEITLRNMQRFNHVKMHEKELEIKMKTFYENKKKEINTIYERRFKDEMLKNL